IHTVRAGEQDIMTMRERGVSVAHCPRSNRAHGHGDAPLRDILEAGIPTGVGTDSVASVSPLDLMAEVRLARKLGGLSAVDALSLVTTGAARALGLYDEVGALLAGRWADLVAIRAGDVDDPYEAVVASGKAGIAGTWLGGRQVAGEMTS
ncbi:MAG: amidohydrolase family protein, partial [Gemmatimonadales bacterium]